MHVPIVTSIDRDFVPIFSVLLASLVESSRSDCSFEVIVLTEGIGKEEIRILSEQLKRKDNYSLRAIEMDDFDVPNLDKTWFKKPAFFRLALPELLEKYEKILYMDSDMVAVDDPAILFETDIRDVYAGVIRDEIQRAYAESEIEEDYLYGYGTVRRYWERHLGLDKKAQDTYFNSGLMILNLERIRSDGLSKRILDILYERPYVFADQDILNIAFAGDVRLLDQRWNLFHILNPKLKYSEEYLKSRKKALVSPGFLHFAWKKPWREPIQPYTEYFWFYARMCPYYERIALTAGLLRNPDELPKESPCLIKRGIRLTGRAIRRLLHR